MCTIIIIIIIYIIYIACRYVDTRVLYSMHNLYKSLAIIIITFKYNKLNVSEPLYKTETTLSHEFILFPNVYSPILDNHWYNVSSYDVEYWSVKSYSCPKFKS